MKISHQAIVLLKVVTELENGQQRTLKNFKTFLLKSGTSGSSIQSHQLST
jgi:hypothetical protein